MGNLVYSQIQPAVKKHVKIGIPIGVPAVGPQ